MSFQLHPPTPVLRIFDEALARDFYVGFLGFTVDWEHRFGDNFPLYMQVSQGECCLHLTGHHGDCCPGASLRIATPALEALQQRLAAADYKYAKPGIEQKPWGSREMTVTDPFGNRLTFVNDEVPAAP